MRGFVIENKDADENGELTLKSQIRREMIEKLATEWNEARKKIEYYSFRSEQDIESEEYAKKLFAKDVGYDAVCAAEETNSFLTEEDKRRIRDEAIGKFYQEEDKRTRVDYDRLEVIEELLGQLGARMMRPYEHWNEEEKYIEYMETRYDNY